MAEVIELEFDLPDVLALRMVQQPRELPADMGALIAGMPGPSGPVGDANGALLVTARLAEFATEEAKAAARANIGLAVIDGGTFF